MQHQPDISVIIVNYNTADLITRCLDDLHQQVGVTFEIIVVDNASADSSCERIRNYASDKLKLIESQENLGFNRGNNLGARSALGKYLYLLNPDTEVPKPNTLKTLLDYAKAKPEAGLIGTPLLDEHGHNTSKPKMLYPCQALLTEKMPTLPGEIAWVIGASMFIPRTVFDTVGGLDPDFFLYGDETDLCWRIREAGFTIDYCDAAAIYHLGGGSERKSSSFNLKYKKMQGLILFFRKHYSQKDLIIILKRYKKRAIKKTLKNKILLALLRQEKYKAACEHNRAIIVAADEFLEQNTQA